MESAKAEEERKQRENLDYLNLEGDPEIRKGFVNGNLNVFINIAIGPKEIIMLSCKVVKYNKYNWQQERNLVITQDNIYNFKSKSRCSLKLRLN